VIPPLIDNVFRVAVDPLFPPPNSVLNHVKKNPKNRLIPDNLWENNKFELIFDEDRDTGSLQALQNGEEIIMEEEEEEQLESCDDDH
jgi:hypothetical protein